MLPVRDLDSVLLAVATIRSAMVLVDQTFKPERAHYHQCGGSNEYSLGAHFPNARWGWRTGVGVTTGVRFLVASAGGYANSTYKGPF